MCADISAVELIDLLLLSPFATAVATLAVSIANQRPDNVFCQQYV